MKPPKASFKTFKRLPLLQKFLVGPRRTLCRLEGLPQASNQCPEPFSLASPSLWVASLLLDWCETSLLLPSSAPHAVLSSPKGCFYLAPLPMRCSAPEGPGSAPPAYSPLASR